MLAEDNQRRLTSLVAAGVDQGAQSIVTLMLLVLTARLVSPADFGVFGIVLAGITAVWVLSRAAVVEPYLIKASADAGGAGTSIGTIFLMLFRSALVFSLVLGVVAILTSGFWRTAVVFAAVSMPLIAALECGRAAAIAGQKRARSLQIAATWVVVMTIGGAVVLLTNGGVVLAFCAFVVATGAGAIVGLCRLDLRVTPQTGAGGFDSSSVLSLGVPLAADAALTLLTVQALVPLVGAVVDLEAAAGVRGATTMAGPLTTLIAGLRLGVLADASRFNQASSVTNWGRYFRNGTLALLAVAIPAAAVILVFSNRFGAALLNESWPASEPLVLPMLLVALVSAPHLVGSSILRARQRANEVMRLRLVVTVLIVVPELTGVLLAEERGAVLGLLVGASGSAVLWARAAVREVEPGVVTKNGQPNY